MKAIWRNDGSHAPDPVITTPMEIALPCTCVPLGACVDWPDMASMLRSIARSMVPCDSHKCRRRPKGE